MFRNKTTEITVTYHIGYTVNPTSTVFTESTIDYKPLYCDVKAHDKARLVVIHRQLSERANEIASYRNTTQHLHVKIKGFVNGAAIPNFETNSLSQLYDYIQGIEFTPTQPRRKWGVELRM